MLKAIARAQLRKMAAQYDYDVSYMEALLDISPHAFFKFGKLMQAAQHREVAPVSACFAAKLVGGLTEDCGPCTQLVVDMALEAGVPADQVEAILRRDQGAMNQDTRLGYRFADAMATRSAEEDAAREAVRHAWGDKGVVDLTFCLQFSRMYPMIKTGLGYAKECRRIQVRERHVDVAKAAA